MEAEAQDGLRQAIAYLNLGEPQAALPILIDFVKRNPNSDQGWWLLSQATPEPKKKADCLRQTLRINPTNTLARQRLDQLESILRVNDLPPAPSPAAQEATKSPLPLDRANQTESEVAVQPPENPASLQPGVEPSEPLPPPQPKTEPLPSEPVLKTKPAKKKNRSCLIIILVIDALILIGAIGLTIYGNHSKLPAFSRPTDSPVTVTPSTTFTALPAQIAWKTLTAFQQPPFWTLTSTSKIAPFPTIHTTSWGRSRSCQFRPAFWAPFSKDSKYC